MTHDVPGTPPAAGDIARRLSQLSPAQRALLERALAQRAATSGASAHEGSADEIVATGATSGPVAFNQELLFRLQSAMPDDVSYNVPRLLRVTGHLDVDALRHALEGVLGRHAVFRTRFVDGAAGASQTIDATVRLPFELVDLTASPIAGRDAEATRIVADRIRRPFDLSRDVLLRATVIRIAPDVYRVLLLSHHIVTDEGTRDILFRDLEALYRAEVTSTRASLLTPAVQFIDYARWQRRKAAAGAWDDAMAFWREQLRRAEPLQLLGDAPRAASGGATGARLLRALPAALLERLHDVARTQGATPYMLLLALVDAFLARYTGNDDISVATPASGRSRCELDGVAGYFTNTTILRTQVDFDAPFADLVERVRGIVLGSFEHAEVPLEHVLEGVGVPGLGAITNVGFVADSRGAASAPVTAPRLAGAEVALVPTDTGAAKFDLTIACTESDGTLRVGAEFRTTMFAPDTVERLLEHFESLITAALADPTTRVRDLPLMSHAERETVVEEWNATTTPYRRDATVHELIAEVAHAAPDDRAIVGPDATLTFAELEAAATRVARTLGAQGVGEGDIVGVVMHRSAALAVALLGVLKAGAAYVPIDPAYPESRIADMLDDSGASVVLADADLVAALPATTATVVCIDATGGAAMTDCDASADVRATPDSLAYVIYTSGSTGRPKGAMIDHRGLVNYLSWAVEAYDVRNGIGAPVHSSISFDLTVTSLWVPLLAGRTAFMLPDGDGVDVLADFMRRHSGLSLVKLTPAHLVMLSEALTAEEARGCTRFFVIGGEALLGETLVWWQEHAPDTVHVNEYGPTETVVGCCVEYVGGDRRVAGQVRIGRPIANTRLYVLDAWGSPVPIGVPGELYIGGDGVCAGYLNRAELTAERFVTDPFASVQGARMYRSGDRARWCADGTLEYLGRLDEQVKIRGYRIELGEIEAAIAAIPGVAQAAAAVRGTGGDARIIAFVVGADGSIDTPAIRAALADRLPAHMLPARFVEIDAIPVTRNGKVDRKALLAMDIAEDSVRGRGEIVTETEGAIASLWSEILACEVGADDRFISLGGHSLTAMRVVGRVRRDMGVPLTIASLLRDPSVRELSSEIDRLRGRTSRAEAGCAERVHARLSGVITRGGDMTATSSVAAPTYAPRSAVFPTTPAQQRFWVLDQIDPGSAAYTIPVALRLRGPLAAAELRRALEIVVERHDALRTVFELQGAEPVQIVKSTVDLAWAETDLRGEPGQVREARAIEAATRAANAAFDLAHGPLVRAELLRLADDEHLFLLTLHHIVADGASMGILFSELREAYSALRDGRVPSLRALPNQYPDFALWQRRMLESGAAAEWEGYWRERLRDCPVLDIATDRARPASLSGAGEKREVTIDASVVARVRTASRAAGTTPFVMFLAAYVALLHRYTGQTDIVVGSISAGRDRVESEGVIGLFLDTIPVRVDASGDPTFATLVSRVRTAVLDALANAQLPFERIVEAAGAPRDASRSPVFQAAFQLLDNVGGPFALPGLDVIPFAGDKQTAKFELTLLLNAAPSGGLRAVLEYSTELFERATADVLLAHFVTLAEDAVLAPDKPLSQLVLEGAPEAQTRPVSDVTVPEWTVPERILRQAALTPDAVAVSAGGEDVSYAELARRSSIVARRLVTAGVAPGDRVAVCLERNAALIVVLLGVHRAGAAYIPIDPAYPTDRITHVLADSGARALVTDSSIAAANSDVATLRVDATWWDDQVDAVASSAAPAATPNALAYVIYTSGSTGLPKGVMIPHRALANFVASMADVPGIRASDAIVAVTTISFDIAGLELWLPLATGARVVLASRATATDGAALRALVERTTAETSGKTWLQATPATWQMLIEAGWRGSDLVVMLCGGEAWPAGLAADLLPRGGALWNVYGPTETTIWSTLARVTNADRVALGAPLANTTLHVLEPSGTIAATGVPGELCIGGAGLAVGYHNRPELTAERFVMHPTLDRLYRTGDRVRRRSDGELEYLGRLDDQVKVRGYRIELGEIEAVMVASPLVRQAAAAVRGAGADATIVGYLVVEDGAAVRDAVTDADTRLRNALPDYMRPTALVTLDVLPLTPNGKLDRRSLPAAAASDDLSIRAYVAPRTPLEEQVSATWSELLGVARVGATDDFFSLGGHSLLAMRLVATLRSRLGIDVTVGDVFAHRTVESLAGAIEGRIASLVSEDSALADLMAQLEGLSDEEALRLLDAQQTEVQP